MTVPFAEFGLTFSWAQVHQLAESQSVIVGPQRLLPAYQPSGSVTGLRLGGGEGMAIAQSRCKWWIEGMLTLVKAIDDAPDLVRARRPLTPQRRAHAAVFHAVKEGRLVRQPCEVCGSARQVQAHHDDYSKPLDVHWFCQGHHKAHHAALGTYANLNKGQRHSPRRRFTYQVGERQAS